MAMSMRVDVFQIIAPGCDFHLFPDCQRREEKILSEKRREEKRLPEKRREEIVRECTCPHFGVQREVGGLPERDLFPHSSSSSSFLPHSHSCLITAVHALDLDGGAALLAVAIAPGSHLLHTLRVTRAVVERERERLEKIRYKKR